MYTGNTFNLSRYNVNKSVLYPVLFSFLWLYTQTLWREICSPQRQIFRILVQIVHIPATLPNPLSLLCGHLSLSIFPAVKKTEFFKFNPFFLDNSTIFEMRGNGNRNKQGRKRWPAGCRWDIYKQTFLWYDADKWTGGAPWAAQKRPRRGPEGTAYGAAALDILWFPGTTSLCGGAGD